MLRNAPSRRARAALVDMVPSIGGDETLYPEPNPLNAESQPVTSPYPRNPASREKRPQANATRGSHLHVREVGWSQRRRAGCTRQQMGTGQSPSLPSTTLQASGARPREETPPPS